MTHDDPFFLGARPHEAGVRFRLWAPEARRADLILDPAGDATPMTAEEGGFWTLNVPALRPGTRYRYRLDGGPAFPDPASRYQPDGVHGPSAVIDPDSYAWQDDGWAGVDQRDLVLYELHVGTFTPEGTFRAAAARLPYLARLGVTAVELMPVADFPGRWNWGYDHAALYAPSRAYGSPDDLRAFVDAAHAEGLAVFFDVIYNHLGPDGAYVAAFAPMFTEKHHTPWGAAMNLDDAHSAGVRRFFLDNACHWLREYHGDGLRLDATHALVDDTEPHFLAELAEAVHALDGPRRTVIAEDPRNLNTLVRPRDDGGYGLDAVWADDFHHLVRNLTAGDTAGYYGHFAGATADDLAQTLERGWFYAGQPSRKDGDPRGTDAAGVRRDQCVVCIQNHDQVGNRPAGTRLTDDVGLPAYRAASALLLLAPELPLLFMGQEWAASTPFLFFTDHNEELGPSVTQGRKDEFADFPDFDGDVPDPQDPDTFLRSKLDWTEVDRPPHRGIARLYRDLLALRRDLPADAEATAHGPRGLHLARGRHHLMVAFAGDVTLPVPEGAELRLHTEQAAYAEDGRAPDVADGRIRFQRPGAAVFVA